MRGHTTACRAYNSAVVAAPKCVQWGHVVQWATRMLYVAARQWQRGWWFKLTYGRAIACQESFYFRFRVNIEVQTDSFPGQWRQETPIKEQQSGFFKRPVAVYISNGGRDKSTGKVLLLDKFLREFGSRKLQTQALLVVTYWTFIHHPSWLSVTVHTVSVVPVGTCLRTRAILELFCELNFHITELSQVIPSWNLNRDLLN